MREHGQEDGRGTRGCSIQLEKEKERKKTVEPQTVLIQRVENLQLILMCDQDLKVIWDNLAHVHLSHSSTTCLSLQKKFLTLVSQTWKVLLVR